ncbi:MAG: hypothetical protein DWQ29_24170 [Planctomycetota bacterium]|nr:MAG: hypothetical protein DWQ29_24170 [Planctomycetota bacterium]
MRVQVFRRIEERSGVSDLQRSCLKFVLPAVMCAAVLHAAVADEEPPSAVSSVMRLLKSGRLPVERLGPVLEIVCGRGNEHDLAYVWDKVLDLVELPPEVRVEVLQRLAEAGRTRKVVPAGDLGGVVQLIEADDRDLQRRGVDLAGLWKVSEAGGALAALAGSADAPVEVRAASLTSLTAIDVDKARSVIDRLIAPDQAFEVRSVGIAAMTQFNLADAAKQAAAALASAGDEDDPTRLLDAFLGRQTGSKLLADALQDEMLPEDVAKLALRHMYSIGRSDAELSAVLEQAAGIAGDVVMPEGEQLTELMQQVREHGDPARGESVFRRLDLSCMKCHAVSKAGGQVGPDLSALGSSSPLDYIVKSLYEPDAQIKEAFQTKVVLTAGGLTVQGIIADRTDDKLVLRDADGKLVTIPADDIDDEIEGKSLMPKGLVKFMTQSEIVDLLAFLSQLGRPGEYAVRSTPRMQRWRVLTDVAPALLEDVPNETVFEDLVLAGGVWAPAYSRVNGELPLAELVRNSGQGVAYVQGEVDVSAAGEIGFRISGPDDTVVWIDSENMGTVKEFTKLLETGRHSITLRVNAAEVADAAVRLELFRVPESKAEFSVVDGQ